MPRKSTAFSAKHNTAGQFVWARCTFRWGKMAHVRPGPAKRMNKTKSSKTERTQNKIEKKKTRDEKRKQQRNNDKYTI